MDTTDLFFPFNPKPIRSALLVCGAVGVVIAAEACAALGHHAGALGWVRVALSSLLTLACVVSYFRLRPRPHWGVGLDSRQVTVARPLKGPALELPWEEVSHVSRDGKGGDRLTVWMRPEGQVSVGRQLFATAREFNALVAALQARKPPPQLDA